MLLLLFLAPSQLFAQEASLPLLYLRNKVFTPQEGIPQTLEQQHDSHGKHEQKSLVVVQFSAIPRAATQAHLKASGVELLDYLPDNAYIAVLHGTLDRALFKEAGIRAVYQPAMEDVLDPVLLSGNIPEHARKEPGKIDLTLSFAKPFPIDEIMANLSQHGFAIVSDAFEKYQILEVRVPEQDIRKLAAFPWLLYATPILKPGEALNDKSTATTRANVLASHSPMGYNLTGKGVVIGLGDTYSPISHPDIGRRVISMTYSPYPDSHGIHIGGIAAGSGLLNQKYRGYAPAAKIVYREGSGILRDTKRSVDNYGMVVTSNTYGTSYYCDYFGMYFSGSSLLDQQAFEFPYLQHVFAAGNSGGQPNCSGFPQGFATVLGDYQSAKNIISVGNTEINGTISYYSSKGPAKDGRIKPEIAAPGTDIVSTITGNRYAAGSGTSMSSPAVAGGAALLYERYRQLNQNNNPKNALIKAVICNGATDKGLPGPDYSYGFGQMNLLRSFVMIDKGRYRSGELAHEEHTSHEIVVPPNTATLKVMIYWNDRASSVFAGGKTLVNNLDLTLTQPDGSRVLPKFPSLADPTAAATSGVDAVNNIEQIVIEQPAAGTYLAEVVATKIPTGIQEYVIVYDIIEPELLVSYPLAGEQLTKGDVVNIHWESYGEENSTFNVAYSADNGSSWTTINANVPADRRLLAWTIPDVVTTSTKVRVTRNSDGLTNVGGAFTILSIPTAKLGPEQCEGYVALEWTAVDGATDYEVMLSSGNEMRHIGVTNALKYTVSALSKDSTYYVSVRARKDQVPGRRSVALIRKPDSGTCEGSNWDNDLRMEAILSPLPVVREFTKTAYTADHSVTVRIKNMDDQPQTKPFEVGYGLGGNMHWETVNSMIAPQASLDYTFVRKADLLASSAQTLEVRVRSSDDTHNENNILVTNLRQIPNPVLELPYSAESGSVAPQEFGTSTIGIPGAQAYDFEQVTEYSRIRTSVSPGTPVSQSLFVLDAGDNHVLYGETKGYLYGTFNLSGYNVAHDDIRLYFRHSNASSQSYYDFNRVYIRGSSSDPWIHAHHIYNYNTYGDVKDGYRLVSIEVTQLLRENNQDFTSDFQVRWGSDANDSFPAKGYAIDQIRLIKTRSDVALARWDARSLTPCETYSARLNPVFKNNGDDDCFNLIVKISVDGAVYQYKIDVIRKGESVPLSVQYPSAIFSSGKHALKVWCEKGADVDRTNDTLSTEVITIGGTNPANYFENFEAGDGGWYTTGTNSSWQLGVPNSPGISQAASGSNVWKTNLTGLYNNDEESYLYSPCFRPGYRGKTLSFTARISIEDCQSEDCDQFYIEYEDGWGWKRLGNMGYGARWYNNQKNSQGFWSGDVSDEWRSFSMDIPQGEYLQLRFVFKSNANGRYEGVTLDDIHIHEPLFNIHDDQSITSGLAQYYYGHQEPWKTFATDYGKIVAAIDPRGQNISSMRIKTYLNEGDLLTNNDQIALNRSFVIESGITFEKPVGVRLYIPNESIQNLVKTTAYPNLEKPRSAYDLAISKYSGANQDGKLSNNDVNGWEYISHDKIIKMPYRSGYYFEFETKNFSEFWFAKDYIGVGTPLPVELIQFTAEKSSASEPAAVYLRWSTASEKNFSHFVVQLATGERSAKQGLFHDLESVPGNGKSGSSRYAFSDRKGAFSGTRYYRLKMVDADGSFAFSQIKSVTFNNTTSWHVFPNPSKGLFLLTQETASSEPVSVEVIDQTGRVRQKLAYGKSASSHELDLRSPAFPTGIYIIKITSKEGQTRLKIVKE